MEEGTAAAELLPALQKQSSRKNRTSHFEAGRERGRQEGRQAEQEAQEAALKVKKCAANGSLPG